MGHRKQICTIAVTLVMAFHKGNPLRDGGPCTGERVHSCYRLADSVVGQVSRMDEG